MRIRLPPPWRRRGLGLSLLHESLRRFAARLYGRAGIRVLWRADV